MTLRLSTGLRNALQGQNLVQNGKFTSDTTGWTPQAGPNATLSAENGGQDGKCLKVLESGAGTTGYAYQAVTVKANRKYDFEAYFKLGDGTNGTINIGTSIGGTEIWTSGNITDANWKRYVASFVPAVTTIYISLWANQGDKYNLYDEIKLSPRPSVRDIFDGGEIRIYSGTQPAEGDDVPNGSLLVTIKNGVNGITFDDAVAGVLSKAASETWNGTCGASGTAGWFRLVALGDAGTDNAIDERIDGAVATSGGQLNMSSTAFTLGAVETITTFALTLPMS